MSDCASMREAEHPRRAVRERFGVLRRLLARHERPVRELDAPQPFHVRVAFPAGQEQPRRITLLGTDRLAILPVGDQRVVERLCRRERCASASRRPCPSARNHVAFGRTPTSLNSVDSSTPVHSLVLVRPASWPGVVSAPAVRSEVARALEEVDARDGRKALEIGEREQHRPLDHAVDQQRVVLRIDLAARRRDAARSAGPTA